MDRTGPCLHAKLSFKGDSRAGDYEGDRCCYMGRTPRHVFVAVLGADHPAPLAPRKTRKEDMSDATYFNKMTGFADEMVAAGKPLEDDNMFCYILGGLDVDYNLLVQTVSARTDPISIHDI